MPGKWVKEVTRMKAWLNIASPTLPQLALAQFMEEGGYERHLRKVTTIYRRQVERMSELIAEYFPPETRITRPQGGFLLWVELPEQIDSVDLHDRAIKSGISICPGVVFSVTGKYRNCLRLNCGLLWTAEVERAIPTLGRLIAEAMKSGGSRTSPRRRHQRTLSPVPHAYRARFDTAPPVSQNGALSTARRPAVTTGDTVRFLAFHVKGPVRWPTHAKTRSGGSLPRNTN